MGIKSMNIRIDAVFEIAIEGKVHVSQIVSIEDGKVIVRDPNRKGKGRCWLPFDHVKRDGKLLSKPAKVGDARREFERKIREGAE